jgi:ATP-dependent DNA helicase RecQ
VPPYVVFHDSTLRELARLRPRNGWELRAVKGIGERKALDYGPRLLAALGASGEDGGEPESSFAAEEPDLFELEDRRGGDGHSRPPRPES